MMEVKNEPDDSSDSLGNVMEGKNGPDDNSDDLGCVVEGKNEIDVDNVLSDAQSYANNAISDAQSFANNAISDAQSYARSIISNAQSYARRITTDAQSYVNNVRYENNHHPEGLVYKSAMNMRVRGQQSLDHQIFPRELANELACLSPSQTSNRKRPADTVDSTLRLSARHFPKKLSSKKRHRPEGSETITQKRTLRRHCGVCAAIGKRRDSIFECRSCDVALCIVPCFEIFHTQKDFKQARLRLEESGDPENNPDAE